MENLVAQLSSNFGEELGDDEQRYERAISESLIQKHEGPPNVLQESYEHPYYLPALQESQPRMVLRNQRGAALDYFATRSHSVEHVPVMASYQQHPAYFPVVQGSPNRTNPGKLPESSQQTANLPELNKSQQTPATISSKAKL